MFGAAFDEVVPDEEGLAVLRDELGVRRSSISKTASHGRSRDGSRPGDIDDWDYLPPRSNGDSPHAWFTYVTDEWVDHMATSAELDELLTERRRLAADQPVQRRLRALQPLAKGSIVTLAYLTGIEIIALVRSEHRRSSGLRAVPGLPDLPGEPRTDPVASGARRP